jgi:hypothetical protein
MSVLVNSTVVNPFLDWLTGQANMAAAATRYITVFNGDPQGAGSEVINTITGSANRQDMTAAMAAASGGQCVSDTLITFTTAAVGAATVDYVAVYSAITGGNLLASAQVTSKSVTIGDGLKIVAGALTFAVT